MGFAEMEGNVGAGGVWCQPQRLLFAGFVDNSTGWDSAGLASYVRLLRYAAWPARCLCGGVRLSGQLSGAAACGTAMSPCWGGPSDGQRCTAWGRSWRGHRHLARLSWRPALLPGIRAEPNGAAGASAGGGGEAGWGWRGFLVHTGPCQKPLGWWSPFLSSGLVISHSFPCAGTDRSEPVPNWWSSERNASGALVQ